MLFDCFSNSKVVVQYLLWKAKMKKSNSIYEFLEKYINSGKISDSGKIPSENELAAKFGISRNLVREAISSYVGRGFLERIQGKGTFLTGKSPKRQAYVVGTVLFSKNAGSGELIAAIDEVCFEKGYKNITAYSDFSFEKERDAVEKLIAAGATGIIIYPIVKAGHENAGFFEEKIKQGIKIVFLDRAVKGINTDAVSYDNFGAGLMGTRRLLEQGYKKIAFLGSATGVHTMAERQEGYKAALLQAGIRSQDKLIYSIPVTDLGLRNASEFISSKIISEWQNKSNMPDAIFSANGALTLCTYNALYKNDLAVPEDIAILGFDEYKAISYIELPIPTLQVPCSEMAKAAAELLVKRLEGDETPGTHHITLPVQLCTWTTEKGAHDAFAS